MPNQTPNKKYLLSFYDSGNVRQRGVKAALQKKVEAGQQKNIRQKRKLNVIVLSSH